MPRAGLSRAEPKSAREEQTMTQQKEPTVSVLVSLPREQRPQPSPKQDADLKKGLHQLLLDRWKDENPMPSHAWVRCFLSVGIKHSEFGAAYRRLHNIQSAFDRRVLICPVTLEHHEMEVGDPLHMVNPESGQHEIEVHFRKKRIEGGPHLFLAVESNAEEGRKDVSLGVQTLDAVESCLRISLGARALIDTRYTIHMEVETGTFPAPMATFTIFGPEELPRTGQEATDSLAELLAAYATLPERVGKRLLLGLHWLNIAFREKELLSYWTAFELLAGGYGEARVFGLLAQAYGHKQPQRLARDLGVKYIVDLRNDQAHEGLQVHMQPQGESYLLAVAHDLSRQLAGLAPQRFAARILEGIGDKLAEAFFQAAPLQPS